MSGERWIEVWAPDETDSLGIHNLGTQTIKKYHAAEGQRVKSIRWCEPHESSAWPESEQCLHWEGWLPAGECCIVDATLILPPKVGRQCADGYCRSQPACPEGTCREGKP